MALNVLWLYIVILHCEILENSECEKLICGHFPRILLPIFILFIVTFLHILSG